MPDPDRRRSRRILFFAACLVLAVASVPSCSKPPAAAVPDDEPTDERPELIRRYDYLPSRRAIEGEPKTETRADGWRVTAFVLRGQNRRRLNAVLVRPPEAKAGSPLPVILYLPRALETPDAALDVARALEDLPVAVVSFAPADESGSASANTKREALERDRLAALDARFVLDALGALPGLDSKRVVAVGASQGSAAACIVAGVDARVSGLVSVASGDDLAASLHDDLERNGGERTKDLLAALQRIDPRAYLPFLGSRPVLFVQAKRDTLPRERFDSLAAAAPSGRKRIVWLDEEHRFPFDRAAPSVRQWLHEELSW